MKLLLTCLASAVFTTLALSSAHAGGHRATDIAKPTAAIGSWQIHIKRFP